MQRSWGLTWDYRNRLTNVKIKNSGGTVLLEDRFTYDVWDHRIGKWVDADGAGPGAGVQSWTAYAGDNPYADFDSAGNITMRYLFGLGLAEIYARRDSSGNVAWYLTDMLGSVRQIVNTSGTVLDAITYDSFGNILTETNPSNGDRFKFAGMQWDSEIGQYYVWHRNYLAGPGRFESEDPIAFAAGDSNLYRYVRNATAYETDSTGLQDPDEDEAARRGHAARQQAMSNADDSVMSTIDNMKEYTDDEKERMKKQVQRLLDGRRFNWGSGRGLCGYCAQWCEKYMADNWALVTSLRRGTTDMRAYFIIETVHWDNNLLNWTGLDAGHFAIRITFSNGYVIYLDDGHLGGLDHVFVAAEVPCYYGGEDAPPKFDK